MDNNNNLLEVIFSNLNLNLNEYKKIEILINTIKNDKSIKKEDKVKILMHINNIYFQNQENQDKKEIHVDINEKINSDIKKIKENLYKNNEEIYEFATNLDINNKGEEKKNKIKDVKDICKKCGKHKFKKYDYCYKHCQEEDIIPKNVKRKDFNEYIKSQN